MLGKKHDPKARLSLQGSFATRKRNFNTIVILLVNVLRCEERDHGDDNDDDDNNNDDGYAEMNCRWSQDFDDLLQYIPRNMHTVFALLCFVVVIHWLIFPYPSGLLHWHCGNLTIAPVPAKQPWWIWINTSCEFIMNDCITTTKQSTTKPCAYFLGYTVRPIILCDILHISGSCTKINLCHTRYGKMSHKLSPCRHLTF